MGGVCSTDRRDEKCLQYFGRGHLRDLGVDVKMIIKRVLGK
jgi:hypothetical protein